MTALSAPRTDARQHTRLHRIVPRLFIGNTEAKVSDWTRCGLGADLPAHGMKVGDRFTARLRLTLGDSVYEYDIKAEVKRVDGDRFGVTYERAS